MTPSLATGSLVLLAEVTCKLSNNETQSWVSQIIEHFRSQRKLPEEVLRTAWARLWKNVEAGFQDAGWFSWLTSKDERDLQQAIRERTPVGDRIGLLEELRNSGGRHVVSSVTLHAAEGQTVESLHALALVRALFQTLARELDGARFQRLGRFVQDNAERLMAELLFLFNREISSYRKLSHQVTLRSCQETLERLAQIEGKLDWIVSLLMPRLIDPTAAEGRGDLPPEFARKAEQAENLRLAWGSARDALTVLLNGRMSEPSDPRRQRAEDLRARLAELDRLFLRGANELLDRLVHPEIVLATVGTTSSGKTTVIDLLVGAAVAPIDPQELSAGVLTIHHSPAEKARLEVRPTERAEWEIGDWEVASEAEIYQRLEATMRRYNTLRDRPEPPRPPVFHLYFPTVLGLYPRILDIPDGCLLSIKDLPGSKHAGDHLNLRVIRDHARNALCLLVYDTTQTDPTGRRDLLEQVVEEVKTLGGSPARLLLLGNKADQWDKQANGRERLQQFLQELHQDITRTLEDRLPDHKIAIAQMAMVSLSAEPAMLAIRALRSRTREGSLEALKRLLQSYAGLIPETLRRGLTFDPAEWPAERARQIALAVFEAAHGPAFFRELRAHVRRHLAELVIPPAVEEFRQNGGWQAFDWIVRVVGAECHGPKERYDAEKARLDQLSADLTELRDRSQKELNRPFQEMREAVHGLIHYNEEAINQALQMWEQITRRLEATPPFDTLPEESLAPLRLWRYEIIWATDAVLRAVRRALEMGTSLDERALGSLSRHHRHCITEAIEKIQRAGYTSQLAREGGRKEHTTPEERQQADRLVAGLNELSTVLAVALDAVVVNAAQTEAARMQEALDRLFGRHKEHVAEQAQELARAAGLRLYLNIPEASLTPIRLSMSIHYQAGDTTRVAAGTESIQTGIDKVEVGKQKKKRTVKRDKKTFFGWLGSMILGDSYTEEYEETKYEERPRMETRTFTRVLAVAELETIWDEMVRQQQPHLVTQCAEWLLEQAAEVTEAIREFQQGLLADYEKQLELVHQTAVTLTREEETAWAQAGEIVQRLSRRFQSLTAGQKRSEDEEIADATA